MAPTSSARPAMAGTYWIVATSVARLTAASATPGVFLRNRSIRFTHDAQVMPSIGSWSSAVAETAGSVGAEASVVILPGSIPSRSPDAVRHHPQVAALGTLRP